MEIGDLATWFTAVTTLLLVMVTLYVAFYDRLTEKKRNRADTTKAVNAMAESLVRRLEKTPLEPGSPLEDLTEYKVFSIYLLVRGFMQEKGTADIVSRGNHILALLTADPSLSVETKHEVEKLLP